MEFPDLGQQCLVQSCNKLDFLPIKCDSCSNIFCGDHYKYDSHNCPGGLKDNQVPVCPLCSAIIPIPKGVLPDLVVGQHIDNDCKDERAGTATRKLTNKCNVKGCKQRELIPVLCSDCKRNYCLRHRHTADHECDPREARIGSLEQKMADVTKSKSMGSKITNYFKPNSSNQALASGGTKVTVTNARPCQLAATSINGGLKSDEALARALHESMNGSALPMASSGQQAGDRLTSRMSADRLSNVLSSVLPTKQAKVPQSQEEEDEMLAKAIANSEREVTRTERDKCCVS